MKVRMWQAHTLKALLTYNETPCLDKAGFVGIVIACEPFSDCSVPFIAPDGVIDFVLLRKVRTEAFENMLRILLKVLPSVISAKIGRRRGRLAPTMPNDDSTIGQYTTGVMISMSLL